MARGIYKFFWDCGRSGEVEGIFTAESEDVAKILGTEIYFGEILGKHSEVYGKIDDGDIVLKSDSAEAVKVFDELGLDSGYNPFDYLPEDYGDEDEDEV